RKKTRRTPPCCAPFLLCSTARRPGRYACSALLLLKPNPLHRSRAVFGPFALNWGVVSECWLGESRTAQVTEARTQIEKRSGTDGFLRLATADFIGGCTGNAAAGSASAPIRTRFRDRRIATSLAQADRTRRVFARSSAEPHDHTRCVRLRRRLFSVFGRIGGDER